MAARTATAASTPRAITHHAGPLPLRGRAFARPFARAPSCFLDLAVFVVILHLLVCGSIRLGLVGLGRLLERTPHEECEHDEEERCGSPVREPRRRICHELPDVLD